MTAAGAGTATTTATGTATTTATGTATTPVRAHAGFASACLAIDAVLAVTALCAGWTVTVAARATAPRRGRRHAHPARR